MWPTVGSCVRMARGGEPSSRVQLMTIACPVAAQITGLHYRPVIYGRSVAWVVCQRPDGWRGRSASGRSDGAVAVHEAVDLAPDDLVALAGGPLQLRAVLDPDLAAPGPHRPALLQGAG